MSRKGIVEMGSSGWDEQILPGQTYEQQNQGGEYEKRICKYDVEAYQQQRYHAGYAAQDNQ